MAAKVPPCAPKMGGVHPHCTGPYIPIFTYPRGALGTMTERKRGERSETRSTGQSSPPLAVRRFAGRAVPARRTRRVCSLRSLCAPRSGSVCAPMARRFCALRAPILGTMCPYCAPCGRAICPPTAGECTKNPRRLCRGFLVMVGRSIRQSQKSALTPAKLPVNRVLIVGCSP